MHLHKRCIIVNYIIWGGFGGGGGGSKYREANKDKLMGKKIVILRFVVHLLSSLRLVVSIKAFI